MTNYAAQRSKRKHELVDGFGGLGQPRLTMDDFESVYAITDDHFAICLRTSGRSLDCYADLIVDENGKGHLRTSPQHNDDLDAVEFAVMCGAIFRHEDMLIDAINQVMAAKDETFLSSDDFAEMQAIDDEGRFSIALNAPGKTYSGVVQVIADDKFERGCYLRVSPSNNKTLSSMDFSLFKAIADVNEELILDEIAVATENLDHAVVGLKN